MPILSANRSIRRRLRNSAKAAMTLNNSRQKINDCLGNPVEIGIAVIWRVRDTAMAVFNVDNYMEFRSVNGQIEYLLTECVRRRKKMEEKEEQKVSGSREEKKKIIKSRDKKSHGSFWVYCSQVIYYHE